MRLLIITYLIIPLIIVYSKPNKNCGIRINIKKWTKISVGLFGITKTFNPKNEPWYVMLKIRYNPNYSQKCGGVFISNQTILTTAKCLPDNPLTLKMEYKHAGLLKNATFKELQIKNKIKHHNYEGCDHTSCRDNIGLVHLENPVKGITPICLPAPTLPQEKKARIIGFDNLDEDDELSKGKTNLISRDVCKKAYPDRYDKQSLFYSSKNHAIVCYKGNSGMCYQDQGGPVISRFSKVLPRHGLYGLMSFPHENCRSGKPSMFLNIRKYFPWIIRESNQLFGDEYVDYFWPDDEQKQVRFKLMLPGCDKKPAKKILIEIFNVEKYKNEVKIGSLNLFNCIEDGDKGEWEIKLLINTAFQQEDSSLISYVHRKVKEYFKTQKNEEAELDSYVSTTTKSPVSTNFTSGAKNLQFNDTEAKTPTDFGIIDGNSTTVIKQLKKIKPVEAILIVVLFLALIFIFGALFYELCSCGQKIKNRSKKYSVSENSKTESPENEYVNVDKLKSQQNDDIQIADYQDNLQSNQIQTAEYQEINGTQQETNI